MVGVMTPLIWRKRYCMVSGKSVYCGWGNGGRISLWCLKELAMRYQADLDFTMAYLLAAKSG